MPVHPDTQPGAAFSPEIWQASSRALLAKLIAELAYEKIVEIEGQGPSARIALPDGTVYAFDARRYVFDNWTLDPTSIRRITDEAPEEAICPLAFCVEALPQLGVAPMTLSHYIRELGNTLLADAHSRASATLDAEALAGLDEIALDGETTGHPWIIVSKGRIGLGYSDYLIYAPEARRDLRIRWVGALRDHTGLRAVGDQDDRDFAREALGEAGFAQKRAVLEAKAAAYGRSLDDYRFMPVHPWQWDQFILTHFAADIAQGAIVDLGEGEDLYRPQQSVRTLSNISHSEKPSIKLCMTMLNTAVYRGIPGERALTAAPLTEWLDGLMARDAFLRDDLGLILLGERCGLHYAHPLFSRIEGVPYQYNEMMGCLYRDSLASRLSPGETGLPLAALLHQGADGVPLAEALAARSGRPLTQWVERFLDVLITPVLHLLVRHGLGFSAHGQNATLIVRDGWPVRLALRDFIDDVNVCDLDFPETQSLPADVADVLLRLPPDYMRHFVHTTLFVCVLRFVSTLLSERSGLSEAEFWRAARRVVDRYAERFPELSERLALFDILGETYPRLCLNRVRLFTHGYSDDAERPVPDWAGEVRNPLRAFETAAAS